MSAAPSSAPESGGDDAAVAVVSLYAKTKKIHPRAVSGWFAAWRWVLVWATQIVFYGLPWLQWGNRPAVLFDLAARRFYIFGLVLYPQDFIYLTGILIVSAYSLFLFTAVAGRLWCGYACPQTVYTEIFLWIEHRFEGDRMARIKLDAGPWTFNRVWRKAAKQAAWVAFSLWTGISFVGYFSPIRQLVPDLMQFALGPWQWFWVLFYGFATYGNAGYMREQVCKYMCPYARFQSAMFDKDTLIISYDAERGDPRGTRSRKIDARSQGLGDCIDCGLCVQVCPTGIDIRKGLQYECIGCAACIDVCDGVMDKMHYPRGLVRYVTQHGQDQKLSRAQMWQRVFRPRVLIYTAVLVLIVGALGTSLWLRSPFRVDIVRDRATLAREVENGQIENVFRIQVMNTTEQPQRYRIGVAGLPDIALVGAQDLEVLPAEAQWQTVVARIPHASAASAGPGVHPIRFRVERLGETPDADEEKSTFIVPR
ncbi:MAG: cytochrome c oxidase accessory protein CcoG [Burkholderiales bacterium]|nr:cytochrome c oxidase accessory protein CcoG [Burkholderiales bacterium]MDE2396623.1 cytochrome c oxidase accessory protein CcoG [Burkholderiales bacterium]MDE2457531.1 cytochrome c oxidase accessory protein CcoG [Burkholderiales bacterium]